LASDVVLPLDFSTATDKESGGDDKELFESSSLITSFRLVLVVVSPCVDGVLSCSIDAIFFSSCSVGASFLYFGGRPRPRFGLLALSSGLGVCAPSPVELEISAIRPALSTFCSADEPEVGFSTRSGGFLRGRPRPLRMPFARSRSRFSAGDSPMGYFLGRPRPRFLHISHILHESLQYFLTKILPRFYSLLHSFPCSALFYNFYYFFFFIIFYYFFPLQPFFINAPCALRYQECSITNSRKLC
jgi:hypothetical protein